MKKSFLLLLLVVSLTATAQESTSPDVANHLSISASAGTTGIGFEVAIPMTDYVNLRAGYEKMPRIRKSVMVSYYYNRQSFQTEVEGNFNLESWKILLDVYPSKYYTFHVSMGFFSGETDIVTVQNVVPLNDIIQSLPIGGYDIIIENGYASASIRTNKTKPYLGIGFGRAVPKKRIGIAMDLGVLFWGTPTVNENYSGQYIPVDVSDFNKYEESKYIKTISKIKAWPVLSVRFVGRIL